MIKIVKEVSRSPLLTDQHVIVGIYYESIVHLKHIYHVVTILGPLSLLLMGQHAVLL